MTAVLEPPAAADMPGTVGETFALIGEHIAAIRTLRAHANTLIAERDAVITRETGLIASLTDAERRVAALVRSPLSAREIGEQLHLSENTVKTHLRNIYRKLGVDSRSDARAALAGGTR